MWSDVTTILEPGLIFGKILGQIGWAWFKKELLTLLQGKKGAKKIEIWEADDIGTKISTAVQISIHHFRRFGYTPNW